MPFLIPFPPSRNSKGKPAAVTFGSHREARADLELSFIDCLATIKCLFCVFLQIKQEQRDQQHDAVAGTMKRYHQHNERKKDCAQLHLRVCLHPLTFVGAVLA